MKQRTLSVMLLLIVGTFSVAENYGDVYTGTYQMYAGTSYRDIRGTYPMTMEINYIERLDAYVIKYIYAESLGAMPINDLFVAPIRDYVYFSSDEQWGDYYIYLDDETGNDLLLVSHDEDDNEPFIRRFTRIENIRGN